MASKVITPTYTGSLSSGAFNTSTSGTISWTVDGIPDGSTITSIVIKGTIALDKSSAVFKVNGVQVANDIVTQSFAVDIGTDITVTSVTTTLTDGSFTSSTATLSDVTVEIAYFEAGAVVHTVTFIREIDGAVISTVTVEQGYSVTPPDTTYSGYTFWKWVPSDMSNIQSDCTFTAYYKGAKPVESVSLPIPFIDVAVGGTTTITYAVIPVSPSNTNFSYSIADSSICNVTELTTIDTSTGLGSLTIGGLKVGTTTLTFWTVEDPDIKSEMTVQVVNSVEENIKYDLKKINLGSTASTMFLGENLVDRIYLGDTMCYNYGKTYGAALNFGDHTLDKSGWFGTSSKTFSYSSSIPFPSDIEFISTKIKFKYRVRKGTDPDLIGFKATVNDIEFFNNAYSQTEITELEIDLGTSSDAAFSVGASDGSSPANYTYYLDLYEVQIIRYYKYIYVDTNTNIISINAYSENGATATVNDSTLTVSGDGSVDYNISLNSSKTYTLTATIVNQSGWLTVTNSSGASLYDGDDESVSVTISNTDSVTIACYEGEYSNLKLIES